MDRVDALERMDTETLSPAALRGALKFLALANRRFGGNAVVLKHFDEWRRGGPTSAGAEDGSDGGWRAGETITVLDVGTGGADIPVALARWARARGLALRVTALDIVPAIAAVAEENARAYPEITVRQEDFRRLAARGETFDYVISSLFLHHCPPAETVDALRAFDRLARRGALVSDLLRSSASYWAVTAFSWLAGNAVVRHDGPLSVRRAFRPDELEILARTAGLEWTARREPWFRVSLSLTRSFGPPSPKRRGATAAVFSSPLGRGHPAQRSELDEG